MSTSSVFGYKFYTINLAWHVGLCDSRLVVNSLWWMNEASCSLMRFVVAPELLAPEQRGASRNGVSQKLLPKIATAAREIWRLDSLNFWFCNFLDKLTSTATARVMPKFADSPTENSWPTVLKVVKVHEFYHFFKFVKKFVSTHLNERSFELWLCNFQVCILYLNFGIDILGHTCTSRQMLALLTFQCCFLL